MPTPSELFAAIQSAKLFDPASARQEHTDNAGLWQLYLDLAELDAKKLEALIEPHGASENAEKLKLRKALATAINVIPSVLDIVRQYLFAEEPTFDAKGDKALESFLKDCDGNGTGFAQYMQQTALPLAMTLGWIDALVQNPAMDVDAVKTVADAAAADITPRVFTITPLQRLNWSCRPNDAYNWLTFRDKGNEPISPFKPDARTGETYITLMAARTIDPGQPQSVWIRSGRNGEKGEMTHEADYAPTERVPVATLYYRKSNDPERRHWGLSKLAIMAVLTKGIIQILSWTHEDILANLAIYCFPSPGGKVPKNEDGTERISNFSAFTILWFDKEAKNLPTVLQGATSHIEIKLKLVEIYLREILRLAHLVGLSGEGSGTEKSGFHAIVNRNELFQELSDLAGQLDQFALDVFALVKSWSTGEDWTRERMNDELGDSAPTASFYKGPYVFETVEQLLKDSAAAIQMFREVSPKLVESQYKTVARALVYQDDPDLEKIIKEVESNTGSALALAIETAALTAAAQGLDSPSISQTAVPGGEADAKL